MLEAKEANASGKIITHDRVFGDDNDRDARANPERVLEARAMIFRLLNVGLTQFGNVLDLYRGDAAVRV